MPFAETMQTASTCIIILFISQPNQYDFYLSGGLRWHLLDGDGWVPRWEDCDTWHSVCGFSITDLRAFDWFEAFVKRLCADRGISNPFKDGQSIDTADTFITNKADENSGECACGDDLADATYDFVRRVRFVYDGLKFIYFNVHTD